MPDTRLSAADIVALLRGKIHQGYAIGKMHAVFLHEDVPESSILLLLQSEQVLSGAVQQKVRQFIYQQGRSLGLNIYSFVYDALDGQQNTVDFFSDDNVQDFKMQLIAIEQAAPDSPAQSPCPEDIHALFKKIDDAPNYARSFAILQSFLLGLGEAFHEALFNARSLQVQIEHFKKSTQGESPWRFGADVAMRQIHKNLSRYHHKRFMIFRGLRVAFALLVLALLAHSVLDKFEKRNQRLVLAKAPPAQAIGGIIGRYFKGQNFQTFVAERVDSSIDLSLNAKQRPMSNMPKDKFSIRWEGFLYSEKAGKQVFCSENDDGVRVWLGEKLIIDDWTSHWERRNCKTITVQKGWYALKVDYFEKIKSSRMRLLLGDSLLKTKTIPAKHYCCTK